MQHRWVRAKEIQDSRASLATQQKAVSSRHRWCKVLVVVIYDLALLGDIHSCTLFLFQFNETLSRVSPRSLSLPEQAACRGASLDEKWIKVAKRVQQQQERANDLVNAVNKASFLHFHFIFYIQILSCSHSGWSSIADVKKRVFASGEESWFQLESCSSNSRVLGDLSASTPHVVRGAAEI